MQALALKTLKPSIGAKVPARTRAKLRAAAAEHIEALHKAPDWVKKFFQDHVKYAA